MTEKKNDKKIKPINIENKKAYHDYFVEDKLECGIELRGNEVKSVRAGKASIKEGWVSIDNGELVIKQMHITQWDTSNKFDVSENRVRKLLAHKNEILKLYSQVQKDGYTLMPLKVYINDRGKVKVVVGLCKGKHNYDKRQVEKDKQMKRDASRAMKGAY